MRGPELADVRHARAHHGHAVMLYRVLLLGCDGSRRPWRLRITLTYLHTLTSLRPVGGTPTSSFTTSSPAAVSDTPLHAGLQTKSFVEKTLTIFDKIRAFRNGLAVFVSQVVLEGWLMFKRDDEYDAETYMTQGTD